MEPRDRALLLFGLGLLLVLNPVYLYPGGVPYEKTYTYRAERVESLEMAMGYDAIHHSRVLDCTHGIHHRACVQAHQVGYDGTWRVDNETPVHLEDDDHGLYTDYEYVMLPGGVARPNATADNGSVVLSLEASNETDVMARYAADYEDLPEVGKQAVRDGSATTTRRFYRPDTPEPVVSEHRRFVDDGGTFYVLRRAPGEESPVIPPWLLSLLRIAGVLGGAGLAFHARGRLAHDRLVDGDGPPDE